MNEKTVAAGHFVAAGRRVLKQYGPLDAWLDRATKALAFPVSCKKGCAHCCSLLVATSLLECVPIAERLLTEMPEKVPAIREKLRADVAFIATLPNGLFDRAAFFDARRPCALLADDKTCMVYDVRPTPCRGHMVVSPPELCSSDAPEPKETHSVNLAPITNLFTVRGLVSERNNIPPAIMSLAQGVLVALDLLEHGRADVGDGPALEVLDEEQCQALRDGTEETADAWNTLAFAPRTIQ